MARLIARNPSVALPKLPNAMLHQLDIVATTFGILRARVLRVILRECLANPTMRGAIVTEIDRQRAERKVGESTLVGVTMDEDTSIVFADLMASTGARSTQVARAVVTVACDGRLARLRKAFIAEADRRDERAEQQRALIIYNARRLGLDVRESA